MFSRPVVNDDESEMLLQNERATLLTHVASSQQQLLDYLISTEDTPRNY